MRWEDERYVRSYVRDTPEWAALSWEARALFLELLRKVDLTGFLEVGKSGIRGLAGLVRIPIEVVERALHGVDGLISDGCVIELQGGLMIPNYVEAQSARQSDKARKQEQRRRDRARRLEGPRPETPGDETGQPVTPGDQTGPPVTARDAPSDNVTESHHASHPVTLSCTEQSRAEQSSPPNPPGGARALGSESDPAAPDFIDPVAQPAAHAILARLRASDALRVAATAELARRLASKVEEGGKPLAWVLTAIDEANDKVGATGAVGHGLNAGQTAVMITGFVNKARRPKDETPPGAIRYPKAEPLDTRTPEERGEVPPPTDELRKFVAGANAPARRRTA